MAQTIYDATGSGVEIIATTDPRTKIYGVMALGLDTTSTLELRVGTGGSWAASSTVFKWNTSTAVDSGVGVTTLIFPEGTEFYAGAGSNLRSTAVDDWLILTHT